MSSRKPPKRSGRVAEKPAPKLKPLYKTKLGSAFVVDALAHLRGLKANSVNLIVTSPPYALHFKKEYGNANQADYVEWFLPFAEEFRRILTPDGSFVLNIGGAWTPGKPTRSIYQYELLVALVRQVKFHLAQEFYWANPAKLPAPAEWVTVRKIRVKDSVEHIFWFSKEPTPKASNTHVLTPYSPDMERLIKRGYRAKTRPSGHVITSKFGNDRGGAIPPNYFLMGNNDANSHYFKRCAEAGLKAHPARFPAALPEFFVRMLTETGDLVIDPFAGSNTTGAVCEVLGRKWLALDLSKEYLEASRFRFESEALIGLSERTKQDADKPFVPEAAEVLPLFRKAADGE